MRTPMILAPALLLAACGSSDGEGTKIAINGDNFSAGMGKDGTVAIDVPGFKANIDLPKIQLDASDFDINGVSLPAGSKITNMDISGKGSNDGGVRVAFTSPVTPVAVRDWFQGKLAAKGFTLKANGNDLTGTTEDGKAFTLATKANGTGATDSVLTVGQ